MDFKILLEELKVLNLPKGEWAVIMSGCLAVRGLREAHDLDVIPTEKLWNELSKKYPVEKGTNRYRIKPTPNIEILGPANKPDFDTYTDAELIKTADEIDGVLYVNLNIIKAMKQKYGREKDLNDVKLIEGYLTTLPNTTLKSKPWNWAVATAPQWEEPAGEVYPLINRWHKNNFNKLLDLGSGIGRHAFLFAENGFSVEAFDLSEEGVKNIEDLAAEKHLPITTTVGDMLSLPFENNSFDCLVAYHAIYHTDEKGIEKVISEIKRVLKLDGEAFITFNSQNSSAYTNPKNKHLSKNVVFKTEGHEKGIPHYYATKNDIENLLRDFEIINFVYKEEYWQTDDYTGAHYYVLVKNTNK